MTKKFTQDSVLKKYHLNDIVELSLRDTNEWANNKKTSAQGYDYAHTRVGYLHVINAREIWLTALRLNPNAAGGEGYNIPYERIKNIRKAKLV